MLMVIEDIENDDEMKEVSVYEQQSCPISVDFDCTSGTGNPASMKNSDKSN